MNQEHRKQEFTNTVKNFLNEFSNITIRKQKLIQSRKIYDYISSNIDFLTNNPTFVKFLDTTHSKLLEFDDTMSNEDKNIFNIDFYKKIFFKDIYGEITKEQLNIFNQTRNKYYQEDIKIFFYFDMLSNKYNIPIHNNSNQSINSYDKPNVLFI